MFPGVIRDFFLRDTIIPGGYGEAYSCFGEVAVFGYVSSFSVLNELELYRDNNSLVGRDFYLFNQV